jgi:hypothetical protein
LPSHTKGGLSRMRFANNKLEAVSRDKDRHLGLQLATSCLGLCVADRAGLVTVFPSPQLTRPLGENWIFV